MRYAQWVITFAMLATGLMGWLSPNRSFYGMSTFGLVGIWLAIETKIAMRARNREIEKSWRSSDTDRT